jgi:hypothetical protein
MCDHTLMLLVMMPQRLWTRVSFQSTFPLSHSTRSPAQSPATVCVVIVVVVLVVVVVLDVVGLGFVINVLLVFQSDLFVIFCIFFLCLQSSRTPRTLLPTPPRRPLERPIPSCLYTIVCVMFVLTLHRFCLVAVNMKTEKFREFKTSDRPLEFLRCEIDQACC